MHLGIGRFGVAKVHRLKVASLAVTANSNEGY